MLDTARNIVLILEPSLALLHLHMARRVRLVHVRIGHVRTKPLQLDLLSEATCATHDCSKEARVANFPKFESQVDGRVTSQVVAL